MKTHAFCLFTLILISSCLPAGMLTVSYKKDLPSVNSVEVQSQGLIIQGKNLESITSVKLTGTTQHNFIIQHSSPSRAVLKAKSSLSILTQEVLNLIISSAHGDVSFPISFELQNGQVTASKLHSMGATSGQVLQYNGLNWAPADLSLSGSGGSTYVGTYNASTNSPDILAIGGPEGSFYITSVAGVQNFGSGPLSFNVGDWIIFNGSEWERIPIGTAAIPNPWIVNGSHTYYPTGNVGIGVNNPSVTLDLGARTDAIKIPSGTTAERPATPSNGLLRFNSENNKFEIFSSGSWRDLTTAATGGGYLSEDGGTISGSLTVSSGGASITGGINANNGSIINASTVIGSSALTVAAGGTNQNLALNASGTGSVNIGSGSGTSLSVLSNGQVGIGTTNPGARLHVMNTIALENSSANAEGGVLSFWKSRNYTRTNNNDDLGSINFYGHDGTSIQRSSFILSSVEGTPTTGSVPGSLSFHTTSVTGLNSSEKMRITANGNVGIGTTTPLNKLEVVDEWDAGIRYSMFRTYPTDIRLFKGRGTPAAPTAVQSGDNIGGLQFYGYHNGSSPTTRSAAFEVQAMENFTSTAKGADILIRTASIGANTADEKVRIRSNGNVGIGISVPLEKLSVVGDIRTTGCLYYNGGSTGVCASDEKIKEEIEDFSLGLDELMGIRPVYFKYNGKGGFAKSTTPQLGFIAQEVEKAAPQLVITKKVKLNPGDKLETEIKAVDYGAFTYLIINSIKELTSTVFEDKKILKETIANIQQEANDLRQENKALKDYLCRKDSKAEFCSR